MDGCKTRKLISIFTLGVVLLISPETHALHQEHVQMSPWVSLHSRELAKKYQGRKRVRHFHVENRRSVQLEKTGFWSRKPYQFATPVVDEGMLYVGVDVGRFYAIDLKRFVKTWMVKLEGGVHAAAATDGPVIYVADIKGFFYALAKSDGHTIWRVHLDDEIYSTPFVHDDRVYILTASGRLYAFQKDRGDEVWHTDSIEKPYGFSVRAASSPRLLNDTLYVGSSSGLLIAYRIQDGSIKWIQQLGDRQADVYGVDSTPLLIAHHLYSSSADGGLFCLDPLSGRVIWQTDGGGVGDLLEHDGILYSSSGSVLSAMHADSGELLWQQDFEGETISAPQWGEKFLTVTSTTKKFYLVDHQTGDVLFGRFIKNGSYSDPIVVRQNEVYVLSNAAKLYGFRIREIPRHQVKK